MNTKASKLLSVIKQNNLETVVSNESFSESEQTDLDFVLDVIEEFELGTDCLKSNYTDENMESVIEMLEEVTEDEIDEDLATEIAEDEMSEIVGSKALDKPIPYHDKIGNRHNRYTTIMKGRRDKNQKKNRSILQLPADQKFYDQDNAYYIDLWKTAMASKAPKQAYRRLIKTLVNLVVNFKKRNPEISKKAAKFVSVVKTLSKPAKYRESDK